MGKTNFLTPLFPTGPLMGGRWGTVSKKLPGSGARVFVIEDEKGNPGPRGQCPHNGGKSLKLGTMGKRPAKPG